MWHRDGKAIKFESENVVDSGLIPRPAIPKALKMTFTT